jgi:hypothetical protein
LVRPLAGNPADPCNNVARVGNVRNNDPSLIEPISAA